MNIDGNQVSVDRFCGLTMRELGTAAQGISYPVVTKAVLRLEQRLQRDRHVREVAIKADTNMSYCLMSRRDCTNSITMHKGPDKMRWRAVFVLSVILIGIIVSECSAQSPDPITLIQGVEMARLHVPPSRLHFHLVYRDSSRTNEKNHEIEFDGARRRSVALTPQDASLFYDGSQVCLYLPSYNQASFRDIYDGSPDPLFDPRTLGLNSGLVWGVSVSEVLPYKKGRVEMVGREQVRGSDTWHVRISIEDPTKYQIDLWIGDNARFPVYRYDMTFDTERRTIISFYEDQSYTWLPSKVDASSFDASDALRYGLAFTLTKAEANVAFSETNWTLAGLNMPIGTRVTDRRTKLTVGYWNGTNVTPFEIWVANRRAERGGQRGPQKMPAERFNQTIVEILACVVLGVGVPLVMAYRARRRRAKKSARVPPS